MEGKKPMSHGIAGLLIAAAVILVSMITMVLAKNGGGPGTGIFTYATIILGLILVIWLHGKKRAGRATFGELFSYGFKATAILVIVFIGFLLLYGLFVPDFAATALQLMREKMEKDNLAGDKEIEDGMAMMSKNFWVLAIGGTTLVFVIVGALGSLLGAAITKKIPQPPLDQSLT